VRKVSSWEHAIKKCRVPKPPFKHGLGYENTTLILFAHARIFVMFSRVSSLSFSLAFLLTQVTE
jgi:hypothetical protein